MVEEDRYCIDVLTQLQAARAALARVETEMLKDHLGHCIEAAIIGGDAAEQRRKAGELIELLERSADEGRAARRPRPCSPAPLFAQHQGHAGHDPAPPRR